ncbi:DUF5011 domain-containing protein [Stigmatella sp. ncwal1]|uniref:DUF5011 domain-containing protein n=1 Tax=Stigmatella ashevillensis TaxID=2995309 RepID=A0ABT5DBA8_9BACT|nr:DUF5011 domain-containing protein [Stigmatella ashevillena]MDC0710939.1 DUF5011 domain-containing protein [Stigmatella ashevillena]
MKTIPPLVNTPRLSCTVALCALLGTLSACGPTPPVDSVPASDSSAAPLPSHGTVASSALTTSAEISVPPIHPFATQDQVTPVLAAGNGVYLVVWNEYIGSTSQLVAARVRASDGVVLDAAPLNIDAQPIPLGSVKEPAVTFDGTHFLVVYSKRVPSNYSYREDIYGKRVRASDGAVVDSNPIFISTIANSDDTRRPTVVFNGTNYLVLWETLVYPNWGLYGAYVSPAGQLLTPSSFLVTSNVFNPQLAAGSGSDSLGVWAEGSQGKIVVGWFSGTVPLAILTFTVAESGGSNPAIAYAYDGNTFLVVWNEAGGIVKARRVRLSQVKGQPFGDTSFLVGEGATSPAVVSADAQSFRVTYHATRNGVAQLVSTRVLPDGVVTPDAEHTLATTPSTERPAFASLGTAEKAVAYKQYGPSTSYSRIQVRLVSDVQVEACTAGQPAVSLNGAATLTLECGSGPYVDPGAQAFTSCGSPLSVTAYNSGSDSFGSGPNTGAEGTYSVSYAAWDSTGSAHAIRTVVVEDQTPPTLTLKGPAVSTHTCGSQWVDPGVEAKDACYGNLAAQVWHTGEVNGWGEGTYTVTYTLTDSGGNSATPVTRTVEVVDCPW